jgi:VIT1/CCC1 family predicted Fe2+/Mn2+ transporter
MRAIRRFIGEHVSPADRMAEMIFGLIMALGVTCAIRIGTTDLDSHELLVSVGGCNLAWGIVDGVVLVLMRLFERGRVLRVVTQARAAADDDAAYRIVEDELAPDVVDELTADERSRLKEISLAVVRRVHPEPPTIGKGDFLHGIAAGLVVVLPTIPVVVPYVLFSDPVVAVRTSYGVALALLFWLGAKWAEIVGARPWRLGSALVALGVVLVGITTALGG